MKTKAKNLFLLPALIASLSLGSRVVWSTNSPASVVIAGQNTVTNPITGPQQFYRLVR